MTHEHTLNFNQTGVCSIFFNCLIRVSNTCPFKWSKKKKGCQKAEMLHGETEGLDEG
jgi:hypothetical protein